MYGTLKMRLNVFSSTAGSHKCGRYNILPGILTMLFINCSQFIFLGNYLPSDADSHTNTVNSGPDKSIYPECNAWHHFARMQRVASSWRAPHEPHIWWRFIDDIFIIWTHTEDDLHAFITYGIKICKTAATNR